MSSVHPPLADVRRTLRVRWYRSPIEPAVLRRLMQRSDLRGAFQAVGHLALAAGTGVLTWYLFSQRLWVACALAFLLHGGVTSFFSSGCHELDHGTVFRTKRLNRLFLHVYGLLAWFNFHDYALSHTYHHRYTLHPDGDREVELPKTPSLRFLYLLQLCTISITGGFESKGLYPLLRTTVGTALGIFPRRGVESSPETTGPNSEEWVRALYDAHPEERAKSVRWARITLLFHATVTVAGIASGLWLLPLLVSFPIFFGNIWKYFVGAPMHCGLRDNVPDFRKCVRTITLDPLSTFVYWRMNWHMEHHMYAGVPCYNLRELSRTIAGDLPAPRTLVGAWREMRATWKRQQTEPDYQYDTPVPTPGIVGNARARDDDGLGASIGDLAPGILARAGA